MNMSAQSRLALGYVAKLKDNSALEAILAAGVEAKEEMKVSSFKVFGVFADTFTPEEMASWPEPGTQGADATKEDYNSNNPDRYTTVAADGTKINGSFVNDLSDNLPFTILIAKDIEAVKKEKAEPGSTTGRFKGKPAIELSRAKNALSTRLSTVRGMVKDAIKLFHQMSAVNGMTGVECYFETDKDDKPRTDILEPIIVGDTSGPARKHYMKAFSVRAFLRLSVDKAMAKGGGYDNLITSGAKGPNADGTENANPNNVKIENIEQLDSAVSSAVLLLDTIKADKRMLGTLLKHYREAGNHTAVYALFDLAEALTIVTAMPEFVAIDTAYRTGTEVPAKQAA